jgi:hypothetical protein
MDRCLREPRTDDYMPDFYLDESFEWWTPDEAQIFSGVSCYDYNPDGLAPNYHVMVDYTIPDEATVYIEVYSTDSDGRRAGRDD